jgi:hypothetical protein
MSPFAIVCNIHRNWLTPVATRTLASIRHAGDFDGVVHHLKTVEGLPGGAPSASDALWLQNLCSAPTAAHLPWGRTRPDSLVRIVGTVADVVMSELSANDRPAGMAAEGRPGGVKSFAFETASVRQVNISLPTRLKLRQWVLGSVAHVLRCSPDLRTFHPTWSADAVKRLTSRGDWPDGALAWVCPKAAELVRRQQALRRELSISPAYFKACAALLASIK